MTQLAEAVYEHGVLRPLSMLDLREGEHVTVAVEREPRPLTPQAIIEKFAAVYDGLSADEIAEIESHFHRPLDMFADLQ